MKTILAFILAAAGLAFGQGDQTHTRAIPHYDPGAIVVAAEDTAQWKRAIADYVCDGTEDNAEINAAMTQVASRKGGKVFLLAGNYSIADTLDVPSNTVLCGEGLASRLTLADGAIDADTSFMITNAADYTYGERHATGNENITIRDLWIDGNRQGQTGTGTGKLCLQFNTVKHLTLENLFVKNGFSSCIRTEFCDYVIITGNVVAYPYDDGIAINDGSSHVTCSNNHVYGISKSATLQFDTGSTEISADDAIVGGTSGATATVVSVTLSSGSWAAGDAAGTLVVKDQTLWFQAEDLEVASSKVAETDGDSGFAGANGIEVQDGASYVVVTGNVVEDNPGAGGIQVSAHSGEDSPEAVTLTANVIHNCLIGINLYGVSDSYVSSVNVTNNVILNEAPYTGNTTCGLYMRYCDDINIAGNSITVSYGDAIWAYYPITDLSITGNTLTTTDADGEDSGITFSNTLSGAVISGNRIVDFGYRGIDFANSLTNVVIVGNYISGIDNVANATCIYFYNVAVTNCQMSGNLLGGTRQIAGATYEYADDQMAIFDLPSGNKMTLATSRAITAVEANSGRIMLVDTGDGAVTATLPAATVGMELTFVVTDATNELRLDPNGAEHVRLANHAATTAGGDYLTNNTAKATGDGCRLRCLTAGIWEHFDSVGTWTEE